MNMEAKKPFACTVTGCEMTFTNEDHLNWHQKKHDMVLNLGLANKNNEVSDQTPTPTRFIRNCEEVGLFQDLQHVNPFDETFKKAIEFKSNNASSLHNLHIPETSADDTLHTPHIFPPVEEDKPTYTVSTSIVIGGEKNMEDLSLVGDSEIDIDCVYLVGDNIEEKKQKKILGDDNKFNTESSDLKVKLKEIITKNETKKRQLPKDVPTLKISMANQAHNSATNIIKNNKEISNPNVAENMKIHCLSKVTESERSEKESEKEIVQDDVVEINYDSEESLYLVEDSTQCKDKINSKVNHTCSESKFHEISKNKNKSTNLIPILKINDVIVNPEDKTKNSSSLKGHLKANTTKNFQKKNDRRDKIRECNREAQKRCRKKKELNQKILESEMRVLRIENVKLMIENKFLKEELAKLKQHLMEINDDVRSDKPEENNIKVESLEAVYEKDLIALQEAHLQKKRPTVTSRAINQPPILPAPSKTIILQVPNTIQNTTSIILAHQPGIVQQLPMITAIPIAAEKVPQELKRNERAILPKRKKGPSKNETSIVSKTSSKRKKT